MLVIEKFNVKQGFLRKAAESVNNAGVHDLTLNKNGVSMTDIPAKEASKSGPPDLQSSGAPNSPFKMPSFAAKAPAPEPPRTGNAGLFQKSALASPFGRPKVGTPPPQRMPTFGREVPKPNQDVSEDDIELRPYVPKK